MLPANGRVSIRRYRRRPAHRPQPKPPSRMSRSIVPARGDRVRCPRSAIIGAESTMRSNQRCPWQAARSSTVAPIEWPSAKSGGGQSGSTTSFMKASRSRSYSAKSRTWPLRRIGSARSESPCPRQSRIATAKPRARRSRTVSKYFSMNSARPGNRADRALAAGRRHPAGKAQRDAVAAS